MVDVSRRSFFAGFGALIAAPAIVRATSLMPVAPPSGVVIGSRLIIAPHLLTREAVRLFVNSNSFISNISRQYDDEFARDGAVIGAQLRIRLPSAYAA